MRILFFLFTLVCALTFSSCAVGRFFVKAETKAIHNPSSKNHSITQTETAQQEDKSTSKAQPAPKPEPESEPEIASRPIPGVERSDKPYTNTPFSEVESANVRIPFNLNNPFPSSGELTLTLDELSSDFCYPYPGKVISPYGYRGRSMHSGMDIKAVPNDTIRAAFSGVVRMSKGYSGYGNTIVIRHASGIETLYSHQARNLVDVNQYVRAGEAIGLAGRTGRATTEHLHFELRVANQALNPNLLVDPDQQTLRRGELYFYNRDGKVSASTRGKGKGAGIELAKKKEAPEPAQSAATQSTHPTQTKPAAAETPAAATASSTSTQSSKPSSQSAKASTAAKSTSSSTARYHTVKSGDTLSALARNYSTTVAKICSLNGIRANSVLKLKQRLRVK